MSSWMIWKSLHLIIKLPPCRPLGLLSTASTLWWRSYRRCRWFMIRKTLKNTVSTWQSNSFLSHISFLYNTHFYSYFVHLF
jgi:hypothetical protein